MLLIPAFFQPSSSNSYKTVRNSSLISSYQSKLEKGKTKQSPNVKARTAQKENTVPLSSTHQRRFCATKASVMSNESGDVEIVCSTDKLEKDTNRGKFQEVRYMSV